MSKGNRSAPLLWPAVAGDRDDVKAAPVPAINVQPDRRVRQSWPAGTARMAAGTDNTDDTGTAPMPAIQAGAAPPAQREQPPVEPEQPPAQPEQPPVEPEQQGQPEQQSLPEPEGRPQPAEPSWAKVIATTLALWFQRRRYPWLLTVGLVLVVIVPGAVAVLVAWDAAAKPAGPPGAASQRRGADPVLTAQAVRGQAAGWIAAQVSRNVIVSCDPVMCSVLQRYGYPAGDLDVLGPTASDPLDSSLIVATSVLRSQFGTRLTSVYAPVVLASFGTGSAGVQVRAVAPDGAPVYLHQLSADLAARKAYGGQLARNPNLAATASARSQLEQGKVDSRLITVIATLAQTHRLSIVSFGAAAAGADPELPLRYAMVTSRADGTTTMNVLESLRSFLKGQQPPYLPALTQFVKLPSGQEALGIQFAAPYPLELLGTARSVVKDPGSR